MKVHRMISRIPALLAGCLLAGCSMLPPQQGALDDQPLRDALAVYTEARKTREAAPGPATERQMDIARKAFEDEVVALAGRQRDGGEWLRAEDTLDLALKEIPHSKRLLDARREVAETRVRKLATNECRMNAARARYLADKSALLLERAPLEARDYLQDWMSRRERQELSELAIRLRDCANQALATGQLRLAEEALDAAVRVNGTEFVAAERRRLEKTQHPAKATTPAKAAAPRATVTPQQRIRQQRTALMDAMTRGDLKEARSALTELRRLQGDTAELQELGASIDAAIAAYAQEANERASAHYRDRQIEQARDIWKEILELDPQNEQVRTNLDRAERVLKKLEELQGTNPEATAPPVAPTAAPPASPASPASPAEAP